MTLGRVPRALVDAAAEAWRADIINGPPGASQSVLLLVDQEGCGAAEYLDALRVIDQLDGRVGVVPIDGQSLGLASLSRFFHDDPIEVDLATSAFRLQFCADAKVTGAPPILNRAAFDDEASSAADLANAGLLCLQGHSNPVDGGFGRWLTFCSRHLHVPGASPLFPCFVTDRCFRQSVNRRPFASAEGLVNPTTLRTPLLVLDGCSTMTVPTALFSYATSLARSLVASEVRAAVMTHGVTATPLSAFIVFLAMLAKGESLGHAVRETNRHIIQLGRPNALGGAGAGPWIVLGNPEVRVLGLSLLEATPQGGDGCSFVLDSTSVPAPTGALVSLPGVALRGERLAFTTSDGRWARGAIDADSRAYLWIAGTPDVAEAANRARATLRISLRPLSTTVRPNWQRTASAISANQEFLDRLASTVAERGGDATAVQSLNKAWVDTIPSIATTAAASPSIHDLSPATPERSRLVERLEVLSQYTVSAIAAAVQAAGVAKVFQLWPPTWLPDASVPLQEPCSCGAPIIGIARRHALWDSVRILLSCPGCGPIGDVAAQPQDPAESAKATTPSVMGIPRTLRAVRGNTMQWPIRRLGSDPAPGFASAVFIDAFRQRHLVTDVHHLAPGGSTDVPIAIPTDWPEGVSAGVIVVAVGANLSFFTFDLVISAAPARTDRTAH
jgi:hypothetical protein